MNVLRSFIGNLLYEKHVRDALLSRDKISSWGSHEHIADLEARIADMIYWRDRQHKGSEIRANYSRIVHRLKAELRSALRNSNLGLAESTLVEGGAVGHLMHLYDNRELTFGEIKSILKSAARGELEEVSEKLDGLNIVFTWNMLEGGLKVARAGGDISRGGMDAAALAAKFFGRGNLKEAFDSAFQVLRGAISSLSPDTLRKVFGPSGQRWYSAEIIYAANPNVINYDSNAVVFHGWPVFNVTSDGVEQSSDRTGVKFLGDNIEKMQKAVTLRNWQLRGPTIVRMVKISNGSILRDTISELESAMSSGNAGDSTTIEEYLKFLTEESVAGLGLPPSVATMVVARCLELPGAPTLVNIKKVSGPDYEKIRSYVSQFPSTLKSFIQPIELAINRFAVELLKGIHSSLVGNTDAEVARLRGEVKKAIEAIEASGDEKAMTILKTQMTKLVSVENITTPVEGVVFIYKGNAYKFTGSFAAANQILGLFRYGRGGTKIGSQI